VLNLCPFIQRTAFVQEVRKVRITSSRHGLYRLGYTCATRVRTMRSNDVNRSKTVNLALVQIILCNSRV
jgi:hypothetical protein